MIAAQALSSISILVRDIHQPYTFGTSLAQAVESGDQYTRQQGLGLPLGPLPRRARPGGLTASNGRRSIDVHASDAPLQEGEVGVAKWREEFMLPDNLASEPSAALLA